VREEEGVSSKEEAVSEEGVMEALLLNEPLNELLKA